MLPMRCARHHVRRMFVAVALLVVASVLLAPVALAGTPSQWGVSWNYRLLGKLNSSRNLSDGLVMVITGAGSFNVSQLSVDGGGSYTIIDAAGAVVGSGRWTASTLQSFAPMGPGRSPGEGGTLRLLAHFYGGSGLGALSGLLRVAIQCSMWGETVGPPGYPWPPDFVEAGPYTEHVTGAVMFNLNQ